jgi:PEP-CTERM motif
MGKLRFLLGAAALCALSTPAFAILQIAIDVDGHTFTQTSTTNTLFVHDQTIDGVVVNGSFSSVATDALTVSTFPIQNTNGTSVSYKAVVSDTDFAPPATHVDWTGSGSWDNKSRGSTYSFNSYADAANTQGAGPGLVTPGILVGTVSGSVGTRSTSFADSGAGAFFATAPYSLTLEWNATLSPGAELVGGAQQENGLIPEPSTWVLMGFGFVLLAGIGFGWKRRRAPPAFE